jgi:RNA polymerase sigma factor (sigma-70 family)
MEIENLIKEAVNGNKTALEGVVASIQDNIYYLSLRMLANPDDAQDATQDILIRVITKLSSFRFDSKFNTWVYRVASNYLITEKKFLIKTRV